MFKCSSAALKVVVILFDVLANVLGTKQSAWNENSVTRRANRKEATKVMEEISFLKQS
jgi:hypothetical protein